MIFKERTKLYAPLLQLNIHVHFELVYYILNPPEKTQKKIQFVSQLVVKIFNKMSSLKLIANREG